MALAPRILIANVAHARHTPKHHALRYTVYYLAFPLSALRTMATRLLSVNRANLFSFHEADYGFGDPCAEAWVTRVLETYAMHEADGERVLVTMPRLFGYAFNPVSFWFCLDKAGQVRAVISEVNNTFGERHAYASFHEDHRPITQDDWLESQKVFHVSPFLEVKGRYRFRFSFAPEKIAVWINYLDGEEIVLTTSMVGKTVSLSDTQLIRCFLKYPLVTLKVISMIHVHALRMMAKGIRYRRKPAPPTNEVTR